MNRQFATWYLLGVVMLMACARPSVYEQTIVAWQKDRLAKLTAEDGWLTLAGLFALEEGVQTVGSAAQADVVFPLRAPALMGTIEVAGDSIWWQSVPGVEVRLDGHSAAYALMYPLQAQGLLIYDGFEWQVIRRGDRLLIRLRDRQHPDRHRLDALPYFPVREDWRIRADFEPYDTALILPVVNILGIETRQRCPGIFRLDYEGGSHSLLAIDDGSGELFIMFYDQTNGQETYGGGRYLYTEFPTAAGQVYLDFNRAYCPPCAFTLYATCLLPPEGNNFTFEVRAGEMDPHFLEH